MRKAAIFVDDAGGDASGHDRSQFRRLLGRLRSERFAEYVYVTSFDRVADSPRDLALLKLDLELSGARLVSLSEPQEGLPPVGSQAAIDRRFLRDFQRIVNSAAYRRQRKEAS